MIIQHNMFAWNANRQYKINNEKAKKSTEKLSSGYKINRAADDAAGLAISEKMRRQIRGLNQSAENIQEGIGYVQTADGALNEAQEILQRMNELAVKSANGTNTEEDREYIDAEVQQLKEELDRIFSTTTFNDEVIWSPRNEERKIMGYEKKQAVTFRTGNETIDVTNENCGVVASGGYRFNADNNGISLSWTGHDGLLYETKKIDWNTLKSKKYSFEMSDYFDNPDNQNSANLFDSNGAPLFKRKISFSVEESATVADMIQCIEGVTMSSGSSASMYGRFEDNTGATATNTMKVTNVVLNYGAAYASNTNKGVAGTDDVYDFDAADDKFLEAADKSGNVLTSASTKGNVYQRPTATTLAAAKTSNEIWEMSFYMDGIGLVTATSKTITYWGRHSYAADEKDLWWYQVNYNNGQTYKYTKNRTVNTGTLGDVMSVLTGEWVDNPATATPADKTTPGLLSSDKGGSGKNGGFIEINFNLTSAAYTNVGSFSLQVEVKADDTEQNVLDRITHAITDATIVDFYKTSSGNDYHYFYNVTARNHKIDVPIYGGINAFYVQAGTEAGEHISVKYDCLSILELEMEDTNVLTQEASEEAINAIKNALQEISTQRADFGAYQNRLEHAYNANKNTEENTQASESVIRDADMAKTIVEHSNQNILLQAGQAMLTQANHSADFILNLLG